MTLGLAIAVTAVAWMNQCAEIASTARGRGSARPRARHDWVKTFSSSVFIGEPWPMNAKGMRSGWGIASSARGRDRLRLVRRRLGRRELLGPRIGDEAITVRHTHAGERPGVHPRVGVDDPRARVDVGAKRVHVVVAERVGR